VPRQLTPSRHEHHGDSYQYENDGEQQQPTGSPKHISKNNIATAFQPLEADSFLSESD
jgi:hypothetical protein